MPRLESLLDRLITNDVDFAVVGGYAAVAHGVTLLTQDIDICMPFTSKNLLRLQASVQDLNPVHRMTPQRLPLRLTSDTCRGLKNLYLDTDYGQLDCLSLIDGVGDYGYVLSKSIEIQVASGSCRILGIDALIQSKEALTRQKDRETVMQLKAIRERLRGKS